jgi:hypothetical protein
MDIKNGFIYNAKCACFAKKNVVKIGTSIRVEKSENNIVHCTDVLSDVIYDVDKEVFEKNFEPFETTLYSPRAT